MGSLFSWLDYSEADRRRMLDIVSLLDEKETRDELGLASIRDAFSDLFFPGTSTIQTRVRYFLFIPWIYQKLERQQVGKQEMAAKGRRAEIDLMHIIQDSDDREGNIGRRAQEKLKRLPSNVYWNGLWSWGIRIFSGSQDQYHRQIDSFYQRVPSLSHRSADDEMEEPPASNWDRGLLPPPDDFPAGSSFSLTLNEADYLAHRIQMSHPNRVIAKTLSLQTYEMQLNFVWEHPHQDKFTSQQREQIYHAQNFSELMYGPVLIYNLLLAWQTRRSDETIQDRIEEWVQLMESARSRLQDWSRAEFWRIVESNGARIALTTRRFVEEWWDLCLRESVSDLIESPAVHRLIQGREKMLKRGLARLENPRAGELWAGASGLGRLDYRWGVSQRLLNDITAGRGSERGHA